MAWIARLTAVPDGLALESIYHYELVSELKARIPATARSWDVTSKRWIIDPRYGTEVAELCFKHLGIRPVVPPTSTSLITESKLIRLVYLGATKDRGDGERSALGYVADRWYLLIPESVLRDWFSAGSIERPDEQLTLYGILGLRSTAIGEEVKAAYRRLAKQWHPDVCHEVDAADQFKVITRAYHVLSDPSTRHKYDVGRMLEKSLEADRRNLVDANSRRASYRAPLRCGWVFCSGVERVGRFVVEKIEEWQDIVDEEGRVMVSSWAVGATEPEVAWR